MKSSVSSDQARSSLAPHGVMKVGLNMANSLLVKPGTAPGVYQGLVPDLARALAVTLDVQVQFVTYSKPGPLADDAGKGAWDIAFLAADPEREKDIVFSPAYLEIVASYLVPPGSPLRRIEDVDRAGVRISVVKNSGFHLHLLRHLRNAVLVETSTGEESFRVFVDRGLEALSGLAPLLEKEQAMLTGSTILPDGFTRIRQAIGTARGNEAGAAYVSAFVQNIKANGRVQEAVDAHDVRGVNVGAG